jgi:uncharacterized membrane protein YfcA
MSKKNIWFAWVAVVTCVWVYLIVTGPGFALYDTHWVYAVMMAVGSTVAGFTPEGGGAVAFPVLSLYFNISPAIARDFSLAIQSIGMVSATIWILTRKGHSLSVFKWVPFYVLVNIFGFVVMSTVADGINFKIVQMLFVSLALAFIVSYLITKSQGTLDHVDIDSKEKFLVFALASFIGGCASAMFGTGADMLIYIALTCFYGMKEKISTDISIVTMATITVFGIAYRGIVLDNLQPEFYYMWLASAPVSLFFAPLGNILLGWVKKEYMLYTVLLMNAGNYLYFMYNNLSLMVPTIAMFTLLFVSFSAKFYINRKKLK